MAATALAARRRMTPQESRDDALEAARALLLESGPQAVTPKAVAARIGRAHANLLHPFGSAAGLHTALPERCAGADKDTTRDARPRARAGDPNTREGAAPPTHPIHPS